MKSDNTKQVSTYIDDSYHEKLVKICEEEELSMSKVVKKIIIKFLAEEELE